ncbi:MAG: glycoside hydrolase family 2 TIM barrel-domain containing protein [Spirochaetales bacterium]|nr:glycoside hydrolase family 2 TIM barrel-domain containing protein [Spirochaetales bacterium]
MKTWKRIRDGQETPWVPERADAIPLEEYPRPQMVRSDWYCLNGLWEYAVCCRELEHPKDWDGEILVPFALETAASGVKRPLLPEDRLWYRRTFAIREHWKGKRILLNFEAVDWECRCLVNGHEAGFHRGGYVPFSFDISPFLKEGENELILSVWDPTDSHWQQRGKQVLNPKMCFYTATSGIWQTVWMEAVPMENSIESLKMTPDADASILELTVCAREAGEIRIRALTGSSVVAECRGISGEPLELHMDHPELWSPDNPFLYDLEIELVSPAGGQVTDRVESYFAMRKISRAPGRTGDATVFLNDEPVFLHGPLDQGYWPESGMTAPSEEALLFDLEKSRSLGFNMIRKHIKVECRRWYYHADRLGLMIIQDMMCSGFEGNRNLLYFTLGQRVNDTRKRHQRIANRSTQESREDFERELGEVMNHLHNYPSIVIWCPFNESWGQFDASRIGGIVKKRDPSRLVDETSGWFDQWGGDFLSRHIYIRKLRKPRKKDSRVFFISEYGGYNLQVQGHLWDENHKFGYRMYKNREALEAAYTSLIRNQLIPLIERGLGAAVYTQMSDVEIESNGYFTYDRKVCKMDEGLILQLNRDIYAAFKGREIR